MQLYICTFYFITKTKEKASGNTNAEKMEDVYPPLIDLTPFAINPITASENIEEEKLQVAKKLQDACHNIGFFQ